MKGRNSVMVGIRLGDDVHAIIKERADKKGLTVAAYITEQIMRSANGINHSVNNVVNTIQPDSQATPPLYNPSIHKVGDRVLMPKGKRVVEATVPDVDADGAVIYED